MQRLLISVCFFLSILCNATSLEQAKQFAQEGKISLAISTFEQCIEHTTSAQAHYEFGTYLAGLDQPKYYEKAYRHLKKATELQPHINWLFYFGTYCCRLGKFRDSLDAYSLILREKPNLIPVLYNSGYTFKTAGDIDTAIKLYRKVLSLDPNYEQAHLGLAFALMNKGDFALGWKEHAWNLKRQGKNADSFRTLLAQNNIAGKTILLTPEGGLGDTIHFVRYAQRLHHMGARLIVACQEPLIALLSECPFIDQVIPLKAHRPSYDACATLMSLPALFEDTQNSLPTNIPYIFPPPSRIAYWQTKLKHDTNFKIGICWQPDMHNDISRLPIARRGIPLSQFNQLGSLKGISLYSLQKKEGLDQLELVPSCVNLHLFDDSFDVTFGSFIDTAAVMHSLDLIISTDTATAHLAGAMGKKVWLLLPYATDWRWLNHRIDNPWYPTMRIFRQPHPFDWNNVMHEVLHVFKSEIYPQ